MRNDPRIAKKLRTAAWDDLRPLYEKMHRTLLSLDEHVAAELTTIYVKYKYTDELLAQVFAVIWLKTTKRIDVGLALPNDAFDKELMSPPPRLRYPPLNAFFSLQAGDELPKEFCTWARQAYEYRRTLP